MPTSTDYTRSFFSSIQSGSLESARQVVPVLIDLLHPKNVIDVGCGTGAWLTAFQEKGVADIVGVDGAYVDPTTLLIPADRFMKADLCERISPPRRFDVALSLEVAEHLPENYAGIYLDNLV